MSPRRVLLSSVTLLCALALAACGGGSDTKSTTAAAGSSSNTAASSGTASGSNATADAAATTSPDFKGSGSANLCDYATNTARSYHSARPPPPPPAPESAGDGLGRPHAARRSRRPRRPRRGLAVGRRPCRLAQSLARTDGVAGTSLRADEPNHRRNRDVI